MTKLVSCLDSAEEQKAERAKFLSSFKYANNLTVKIFKECLLKKQPSFFQSLLRLSHAFPSCHNPVNLNEHVARAWKAILV